MVNPYKITGMFEGAIADYCGAPFAVAIESCTMALFLSLMYLKSRDGAIGTIKMPARTYPGVACSILHAGGKIEFDDKEWQGEYQLWPYPIWDAALRFKPGMYHGGFQCLSFHIKKVLKIGRGSTILTDDKDAYEWLKKARFDGRQPVPLSEDNFSMLGWNAYMQPPDAARGLQLLQTLGDKVLDDIKVEDQKYPDLSKFSIYTQ